MKLSLISLFCLLISLSYSQGQEVILKLTPSTKPVHNKDYQFEEVLDTRLKKTIGQIYDSDRNKRNASFNGKLAQQALTLYQSRINPTPNPSFKFQVKIYKLEMKEIYQAAQRGYKGEVQLSLGFYLVDENKLINLVDFTSKAEYGRPANQMQNVEISIQNLFENSWEYFDEWLNTQYSSNRLLAKSVRLNILDIKRKSTKDTVFYDPKRPLTWADFTEAPPNKSAFNATIFSSLSIAGNASIHNGEIVQNIEVKVYMLPGQSWVKSANDYANNHEQRHFDLTRIAADRMIQRLKSVEFEPKLFEATLNDIYLDAYREMNRFQDAYDDQTNNGINKGIQSDWNQAIRKALLGDMESLDELLK
ncbi:hypothetical protein LV84_02968 [Algoriphagus ratkowskyi]|uniref:DUF922 domain-containing protein n=1 Tax=Algoriphagus ratkowskyi TaxID=57028 RepID=A0A2W7R6A4_9BACT|nr:hypothetical protein [Algoriphagus ratkowskyi]PZX53860.1 hypothetical protein LV84_02968 [Algoriphagus ratkowskyi]TXD76735.1 hypothetical protein ESW18_15340 [Algoriphagus ratkowskyi]